MSLTHPYSEIIASFPDEPLLETRGLPFTRLHSGKVRDIFAVDAGTVLIVATDRISAFDVVLPSGIPGKGTILTQISLRWFEETAPLVTNHLVDNHRERLAALLADHPTLIPRSMLVRKMDTLPIEAVVRQFLSGSGWRDYVRTGKVFGHSVPVGLEESSKLPVPIFTPTTKATQGSHDQPLTIDETVRLLGNDRFEEVRDVSLKLFALGSAAARKAGLYLADTKFEFGTDPSGELVLIDEILTPDSSRYWPISEYAPGGPQAAFDKQFVRDYLETLDWDKTAPGPALPPEVIEQTRERYILALKRILGEE